MPDTERAETIMINGLEYKIGKFGYAFYWNNGEWVKSDKAPEQITKAIMNEKARKLVL